MLHLKNNRWSTAEQVERETVLKPAPPPPPSRREVVGGAVEQEQKSKVEQNTVEQKMVTNRTVPSHCSFCAKTSNEVAKLIAGPTVFICDECVILCMDIVEAEGIPTPRTELRKWAVKQAVELHQSCGNYVGRNPTDTAGEFVKFVTEPMPKPTLADAMATDSKADA